MIYRTLLELLPVELGVMHGVSATVGILAWWLRQDHALSVERFAETVHRLVIAPTTANG
jgi:hypothetical protein